MVKFFPFIFEVYHIEFHERLKMLFTICEYQHLFQRYLSSKKCVKYANDITDDVIYSTKYYIEYIMLSLLICNRNH